MNRRKFLYRSTLAGAGMITAGTFSKNLFAKPTAVNQFSMDVLTDEPEIALHLLEEIIQGIGSSSKIVFRQRRMAGVFTSDMVYIKNGALVDFRNQNDRVSNRLSEAAETLFLRIPLENPFLLQFHNRAANSAPQKLSVLRENTLIQQIDLKSASDEMKIEGLRGHVELRVKNGAAQILNATCKHKTCMKLGRISHTGESLVCIPNGLKIAIEGENQFGVDSVAY